MYLPGAWGDQRWMGRQPWERHHRRILPCTFLSHCRLQVPQHRRHTSWRWFLVNFLTQQKYKNTEPKWGEGPSGCGEAERVNTPTPGLGSYIPCCPPPESAPPTYFAPHIWTLGLPPPYSYQTLSRTTFPLFFQPLIPKNRRS